MSRKMDITGQRFGRLVALRPDTTSKRTKWICECDCGKVKSFQLTHLRSGATTSCGCYQKEQARKVNFRHGKTHTSLHNRWKAIMQRCCNPKNERYKDYGGRGITVCEEWNEFTKFYDWSMKNGYKKEYELDRIDNDKGYYPDNCRWCKPIINNHNRRITARIDGIPLRDFAEIHNMKYSIVHSRYYLLKNKNKPITTQNIILYANQLPNTEETR